jgi:phage gp29-like protein
MREIALRAHSLDFFAPGIYLPDPDPILRREGKDVRIYTEIQAETRVASCLESRKAALRNLEWEIDRGKAKSRQAAFIQALFNDLDIDRMIGEILNAPFWGLEVLEVLWKQGPSFILPEDVLGKPLHWFVFDVDNNLRLRTRENPILGDELPPRKFLMARNNPTYEDPYGERLASRVFWPVVFKKGGLKWWVTFAEKYGIPWIVGKHPRGMADAEIDNLADRLEQAIQDAVMVIPEDSSVELVNGGGTSGASANSSLFKDLKAVCDEDIAISILGQNLTTSVKGGSLAAAQVHERVRQEIKDGDKKIVRGVMNQLISWVCQVNFGDVERPQFALYEEEHVDQTQADRDKTLVDTGQIKFTKKYWANTYKLEDDDFDVVAQAPGGMQPNNLNPPAFAEGKEDKPHTFPDQAAIDQAVANLDPAELQDEMDGVLAPVRKLIEKSASVEEILAGLGNAYPQMDDTSFQEHLTKAIFLADVWGRLHARS